jgi:hypothetical protein
MGRDLEHLGWLHPQRSYGISGGVGSSLSPEATPWSGGPMWGQVAQYGLPAGLSLIDLILGRKTQKSYSEDLLRSQQREADRNAAMLRYLQQEEDRRFTEDKRRYDQEREDILATNLATENRAEAADLNRVRAGLPFSRDARIVAAQAFGRSSVDPYDWYYSSEPGSASLHSPGWKSQA